MTETTASTRSTEFTRDELLRILDPARVPADPDEYLRAAIRWHFGEDTGSPFWLRRAATLDFDPIRDVRGYQDLALFPNTVDELRDISVFDLVPRGYGPDRPAPQVFETGGTTGAPKRVIHMPDWIDASITRLLAGPQFAGRPPGNILTAVPTGPHKIGVYYDHVVVRQHTVKFSIDIDPRWVKKLVARGRQDEMDLYVEHVLDQVEDVLRTQPVSLLVITPPLLRAAARRASTHQLINEAIEVVFWGGAHMTIDDRYEMQLKFPGIRLVSRYNSALILEGANERPGIGPDEELVYDPFSPVVTFRVVDPATMRPVEYGDRGQVVMNHVSKGMFIPNNLERDTVIRVPAPPGVIGDSVAAPAPVATFGGQAVIEGVY
jgi:hypothetical protein